jgi:hypothetical protein
VVGVATKWARIVVVAAAAGVAAFVAAPAGDASLLCSGTVQPFAQFGDSDWYFGFGNNGFENGATGWKTSGASVVAGNEPWYVNGSGSHALSIQPGGTAASPLVCAALDAPGWRMFARSNGANAPLNAQIVFYGLLGNVTGILNFTTLDPSGYQSWQPTVVVPSLLSLPLATSYAQLRLTSSATSGSWQVDDVFVDPWVSRNSG